MLLGTTALTVTACAGTSTQQWITDLTNFVGALQNDLPALLSIGLPANLLSLAGQALPILSQISGKLGSLSSIRDVQSLVSALLPILLKLLGPAAAILGATTPIGLGLMAASILIPVIASVFGISLPVGAARAPLAAMSVDEARAVLTAHAARRR